MTDKIQQINDNLHTVKTLLTNNLTNRGVTVASSETFDNLVNKILEIKNYKLQVFNADINTYPKTNTGGSVGNYSYGYSNGIYQATCNGWSRDTRIDITTTAGNCIWQTDFNSTGTEVSAVTIMDGDVQHNIMLDHLNGRGLSYKTGGEIADTPTVNTAANISGWFTLKAEITRNKTLNGYVYDSNNNLVATLSNLATLTNKTLTLGICFGYFGTYDGRGYYHEWKNMTLMQY